MDIITVNHPKTTTIKATSFPPKPHTLFSTPKPAGPIQPKTQIRNPILPNPATQVIYRKSRRSSSHEERSGFRFPQLGRQQMLFLCGFGYWMQGFRCFPWLALNFHMAHNLQMHPSTLLLVQHSANLPMVTNPLYGVLSDALYISGAHTVPYISVGVVLQVLSWWPMALIPVAARAVPTLMACVLLSNLGASITEVAQDAIVAEYGQEKNMTGLQSYAFMAAAAGGILGN